MSQSPKQYDRPSIWVYLFSGILLASLVAGYFLLPEFKKVVDEMYAALSSGEKQRISSYLRQFGLWGPVIIVLMMVVQMFLIVVPSWLLMIVSVLVYGPIWGALLSILAVFVASTVGYFLGAFLNTVTISKIIGQKEEQKMERFLEKYGFGAVFLFRLAPFLSNDAISFVGGMLKMGYWRFIGATLAGITPLAALIGYFGQSTDKLKTGLLWIGGTSLLLYGIYIIWDSRFRKAKQQSS